jgi:hypothetical protein
MFNQSQRKFSQQKQKERTGAAKRLQVKTKKASLWGARRINL